MFQLTSKIIWENDSINSWIFVFSILCWKLYFIWAHFSKHKWHKSSPIFVWFQLNAHYSIFIKRKRKNIKLDWLGNQLQKEHRKSTINNIQISESFIWQLHAFEMSKIQLHGGMVISGLWLNWYKPNVKVWLESWKIRFEFCKFKRVIWPKFVYSFLVIGCIYIQTPKWCEALSIARNSKPIWQQRANQLHRCLQSTSNFKTITPQSNTTK